MSQRPHIFAFGPCQRGREFEAMDLFQVRTKLYNYDGNGNIIFHYKLVGSSRASDVVALNVLNVPDSKGTTLDVSV